MKKFIGLLGVGLVMAQTTTTTVSTLTTSTTTVFDGARAPPTGMDGTDATTWTST